MRNVDVLNLLPTATKNEAITATLTTEASDGKTVEAYKFLFNPSTLKYSRNAEYRKSGATATKVQTQQYYLTNGRTLVIPDLLLESWYAKKSIRPLLDGLEKLLLPDPLKPPIISFVWGSEKFTPAVLTDIDYTVTAWLSGEPAKATVSITLLEVPEKDQPSKTDLSKNTVLTERQTQDASAAAKKYLNESTNKLPDSIKQIVKGKAYLLSTDSKTGEVKLVDKSKKDRGVIGVYDGKNFKTDKQALK